MVIVKPDTNSDKHGNESGKTEIANMDFLDFLTLLEEIEHR